MSVLGEAFARVQAMRATSSCDQKTDKASRDESISGHAGCRLDSRVHEILVSIPCGARAAPQALIARLDSAQNTFAI
jgi:hypothetical protein